MIDLILTKRIADKKKARSLYIKHRSLRAVAKIMGKSHEWVRKQVGHIKGK